MLEKIKEEDVEDNVQWFGRLPYEEIWEHYFTAHMGLCLLKPIPNYENSLATKLFEYMAASLPILASNFNDWIKLVEETNSGDTVDPLDYENIADKVEKFINSPELLKIFGENGRRAFEEKYSWKTEKEKLLKLYNSF